MAANEMIINVPILVPVQAGAQAAQTMIISLVTPVAIARPQILLLATCLTKALTDVCITSVKGLW